MRTASEGWPRERVGRRRGDQRAAFGGRCRDIDLGGKRVVIAGGSSGLGAETARVPAGAGAEVTLAARDVGAGHKVASSSMRVAPVYLADRVTGRYFKDCDFGLDVAPHATGPDAARCLWELSTSWLG
jgi:hypothetical protein